MIHISGSNHPSSRTKAPLTPPSFQIRGQRRSADSKGPLAALLPSNEIMAVLIDMPDQETMDYINCIRVTRPDRRPFELIAVLIAHVTSISWFKQSQALKLYYASYGPSKRDMTFVGQRRVAAACLYHYIGSKGPMFPCDTLYTLCEAVMRSARLDASFGCDYISEQHPRPFWSVWLSQRFRIPTALKHSLETEMPEAVVARLENPDFTAALWLARWKLVDRREMELETANVSPSSSNSTPVSKSSKTFKTVKNNKNKTKGEWDPNKPRQRRLGSSLYSQMSPFYDLLEKSKGHGKQYTNGHRSMHMSMRDYASYAVEKQMRPKGRKSKSIPWVDEDDSASDLGDLGADIDFDSDSGLGLDDIFDFDILS